MKNMFSIFATDVLALKLLLGPKPTIAATSGKPSNLLVFPSRPFVLLENKRWRRGDLLQFSDRPWTRVKPLNNSMATAGNLAVRGK